MHGEGGGRRPGYFLDAGADRDENATRDILKPSTAIETVELRRRVQRQVLPTAMKNHVPVYDPAGRMRRGLITL